MWISGSCCAAITSHTTLKNRTYNILCYEVPSSATGNPATPSLPAGTAQTESECDNKVADKQQPPASDAVSGRRGRLSRVNASSMVRNQCICSRQPMQLLQDVLL